MAKSKLPPETPGDAEPVEASAVPTFVLKKNHGLLTNGRTHAFYAAGTEFDGKEHAVLIHQLIKSGALLDEKRATEQASEEVPTE